MTTARVDSFARDGFIVEDGVIGQEDVARLRAVVESPPIQQLLAEKGHASKGVHLAPITTLHDAFKDIAQDPRILERVSALIGPDIELQNSKLATKPPLAGVGKFAWHQDLRFFPHTNTDVLTVMVMLDDSTPANGCMYMVPGSKTAGILPHDPVTGECLGTEYWRDESALVPITPKAGGISIHHGRTLHYSPDSTTGAQRRSLIFVYRAADAYQLAGPIFEDTGWLVQGQKTGIVRCTDLKLDVNDLPITSQTVVDANRQQGLAAAAWNAARTASGSD